MKSSTRHSLLLILAAFIWGVAFVAQTTGGDAVGPFGFNGIRFLIGGLVLLPVIRLLDLLGLSAPPTSEEDKKILIRAGIIVGIALFIPSNLQQVGISLGTPVGKAGFLTSIYIVLVPVSGIFLGRKCGWNVWLSVALAITGLWLLCMGGSTGFGLSDILILCCAAAFTVQIMTIDHYAGRVDPVRLSCIEFLVCGALTMIPMIFYEIPQAGGVAAWLPRFASSQAWISILYAGLLSSGVAYTLQAVGQQDLHPAVASILMSLESVFSVLSGWVILHQVLSVRELVGCAVIFAGVILAQLPVNELLRSRHSRQ